MLPGDSKEMNERIYELFEQALIEFKQEHEYATYIVPDPIKKKFAELIVKECIRECKQEWYDLNAESVADDDSFRDPRATGIRVGQKAGVLKCISRIKEYFGVEE